MISLQHLSVPIRRFLAVPLAVPSVYWARQSPSAANADLRWMGNSITVPEHTSGANKPRSRVHGLHLHFTKKRQAAAAQSPAPPEPQQEQQQQPQCPVQALLEAINLGIYTDAFLLAGYGSSNAAELAGLTGADLDRIQRAARVPILPHHKSLILAASQQLGMTLGIDLPTGQQCSNRQRPVYSPCPLMNPGHQGASLSDAQQQDTPAAAVGDMASAATTPAAAAADAVHSSSGVAQQPADAIGGCSEGGAQQQGAASCAPPSKSGGSSSFTTARSASGGSSSGSEGGTCRAGSSAPGQQVTAAAEATTAAAGGSSNSEQRPASTPQQGRDATAAADASALAQAAACLETTFPSHGVMTQQAQQQDQKEAAAADPASSSTNAAAPAAPGAVPCPDVLPGLSEIEPAAPTPSGCASSQQVGLGEPLPVAAAGGSRSAAGSPAAEEVWGASTAQRRRKPSLGELLFGCVAAAPAAAVTDSVGAAAEPTAGVSRADGGWFQDLDGGSGSDASNPFLVDAESSQQQPLPAGTKAAAAQETSARQPAATLSPVWEDAALDRDATPHSFEAEGGVTAAELAAAAAGRSAASTPAPAVLSGPLTISRAQLSRPGSAAGRGPVLSGPAATATAAAAAAQLRRRPAGHSSPWEKLPGQVASLAYAKTASLKTVPLPALAAVASGQPRKQRAAHGVLTPGVLTLNAAQLPSRPVSESGFSLRPEPSGRFLGLRVEESAANTAAALQQLAWQQASNHELIQRLLQAPHPAGAAAPGAAGLGPTAGLHDVGHSGMFDQDPYSTLHGPAVLAPTAAGGTVLGVNQQGLLLVQPQQQQPQPQLFAQYSSSSGSFLAPVAVAGWAGGMPAQQPQVVLLSGQGFAPAASAAGGAVVSSGNLQLSEPLPGLQQQQVWQAQDISSCRSERMQGNGMRPGFVSTSAQHSQVFGNSNSSWAAAQGAAGVPAQAANHAGLQQQQQQQQQLGGYHSPPAVLQQRSAASVAGSALGGFSSAQSCIELGTRAADVNNIVLRAKAKAAAKQRLLQEAKPQPAVHGPHSTPQTPSLGNRLLDDLAGRQQLKGAAAILGGQRVQSTARAQVPPAASAPAQVQHSRDPASSSSNAQGRIEAVAGSDPAASAPAAGVAVASGPAAGTAGGSSLAAAIRDGDRVLQMLHEFRELSELDRAVKSRMQTLLHTAAVPDKPQRTQAAAAVPERTQHAHAAAEAALAANSTVAASRAAGSAAQGQRRHAAACMDAAAFQPAAAGSAGSAPTGADRPAEVPMQTSRSGDQMAVVQQQQRQHDQRDSPAKAAGQLQHSDQQQKLAGLHRSPVPKKGAAGRTPAAGACAVEGLDAAAAWTVQDSAAAQRKAARQLWQPRHGSSDAAASSSGLKGAGLPASADAALDPAARTAHVLAAAGMGADQAGAAVQRRSGASVAALVAAVARGHAA